MRRAVKKGANEPSLAHPGATCALIGAEVFSRLELLASERQCDLRRYVISVLQESVFGSGRPGDQQVASVPARPDEHNHYAYDDATVTTWLPAEVNTAVYALSDSLSISGSDVVRNTIFLALHGRLGYEQAVAVGKWASSRRYEELMFSRYESEECEPQGEAPSTRAALIKQIGKTEVAFRAPVPALLKHQLGALALKRGMRTSALLRRYLAAYLLGRQSGDPLPVTLIALKPSSDNRQEVSG